MWCRFVPDAVLSGSRVRGESLQRVGYDEGVWSTRGPHVLHDGLCFLREVECGLVKVGRLQRVLSRIALNVAGD